ncbi:MAG: hypothetical protein AB7E19_18335 [Aeromonas sp.]
MPRCGCAIIPDGAPDLVPSPRRIGGGSIPCLPSAWVLHPKFGEGIVLNFEGVGQQSRVQIQFDDVGAKWLVTACMEMVFTLRVAINHFSRT